MGAIPGITVQPFAIGRAGVGEVVVDRTTGGITLTPKAGQNVTLTGGQLLVPDGSVGSPAMAFASETGTGFRRRGTGVLGLSFFSSHNFEFTSGNVFRLGSAGTIQWTSTSTPDAAGDLVLNRDAADVLAQRRTTNVQNFRVYNTFTDASNHEYLRFGWASNVATIQPVNAGTGSIRALEIVGNASSSGTAAGAVTISGGANSSSGTGGAVTISGGASTSGTLGAVVLKNGSTTRWTMDASGHLIASANDIQLQVGKGLASTPGIRYSASQTGILFYDSTPDQIAFTNEGTQTFLFGQEVGLSFLGFCNGSGPDLLLYRAAANILSQHNGTNAQTSRLFNTFTDSSNGEWLQAQWSGNTFNLYTTQNGTGTNRNFWLGAGVGAGTLTFGTNNTARWVVDANGHFVSGLDNTYDIGATGATRPRTGYFGTAVRHQATFATNAGVQLNSAAYLYSGSGVPSNAIGNDGDIYFNTAGGAGTVIYQRRAGAWVATGA